MTPSPLAASAAIVAALSTRALAAPLTVVNHGFEADFAAPSTFPLLVPQGWTLYDPQNIIDFGNDTVGVLNPTMSTFFPAGAPEGSNVALVYVATEVGAGHAGLTQELADVLTANTRYTLTVEVGNIASGFGAPPFDQFFDLDGFPGYRVQLLAGNEILAQDDNTLAPTIPEGEFRTSEITADIGANHGQLGEPLVIRLINLNIPGTPAEPGIEVDFDDVRLDASPLPNLCPGDANNDNTVDFNDITAALANWLNDYTPGTGEGDANADGVVDFNDITAVLSNWLQPCP